MSVTAKVKYCEPSATDRAPRVGSGPEPASPPPICQLQRGGNKGWWWLFLQTQSRLVFLAKPARPACAKWRRSSKTCKWVLTPMDCYFILVIKSVNAESWVAIWFNQTNNFLINLCLSHMAWDKNGKLVSKSKCVMTAVGFLAVLCILRLISSKFPLSPPSWQWDLTKVEREILNCSTH